MKPETPIIASPHPLYATRREFLRLTGSGFGMLALASLLDQQGLLAEAAPANAPSLNPLAPRRSLILPRFHGQVVKQPSASAAVDIVARTLRD